MAADLSGVGLKGITGIHQYTSVGVFLLTVHFSGVELKGITGIQVHRSRVFS